MGKVIIYIASLILNVNLYSQDIIIKFYSEDIVIDDGKGILIEHCVEKNDKSVIQFFNKLENKQYKSLIRSFIKIKKKYNLNDWLYYKFIYEFSETIASKENSDYRALLNCFLLAKSGYDVRICYDKQIDLYVPTEDVIYLASKFYKNGKYYYNLSYLTNSTFIREKELNLSKVQLNKKGNLFDFKMNRLPEFENSSIYLKTILFKEDTIQIHINKTIIEVFEDYPQLNTEFYFTVPISKEAYKTLVESIQTKILGLNDADAIRYILSFVRLQN